MGIRVFRERRADRFAHFNGAVVFFIGLATLRPYKDLMSGDPLLAVQASGKFGIAIIAGAVFALSTRVLHSLFRRSISC